MQGFFYSLTWLFIQKLNLGAMQEQRNSLKLSLWNVLVVLTPELLIWLYYVFVVFFWNSSGNGICYLRNRINGKNHRRCFVYNWFNALVKSIRIWTVCNVSVTVASLCKYFETNTRIYNLSSGPHIVCFLVDVAKKQKNFE